MTDLTIPPEAGVSVRMTFQWLYLVEYYKTRERHTTTPPTVLNIGCADDPLYFGDLVQHFDIDDWSYKHKWFTQGDAHSLPFHDDSFGLVIMGDMLEHVPDPKKVISEAMRVIWPGGKLVMTVFEEWRLPGHGQWIKEGLELGDKTNRDLGYADREAWQKENYPQRIGTDDTVMPHLVHINQFSDDDIEVFILDIEKSGWRAIQLLKAFEVTHEGHDIYNWLIAMVREDTKWINHEAVKE